MITDYDANGYETTKIQLYKVLETKEFSTSNPVIVVSGPTVRSIKISSPIGVGGGSRVLSGGRNSNLRENPIIIQR